MKRRFWYWLLAVPFVATLVPPIYARSTPELFGFPFFYWYQIAWIVVTVLLVSGIYLATREIERD